MVVLDCKYHKLVRAINGIAVDAIAENSIVIIPIVTKGVNSE